MLTVVLTPILADDHQQPVSWAQPITLRDVDRLTDPVVLAWNITAEARLLPPYWFRLQVYWQTTPMAFAEVAADGPRGVAVMAGDSLTVTFTDLAAHIQRLLQQEPEPV